MRTRINVRRKNNKIEEYICKDVVMEPHAYNIIISDTEVITIPLEEVLEVTVSRGSLNSLRESINE